MKETARTDHLTTAGTRGAIDPARARFCAAAVAFIAGIKLLDLNRLVGAKSHLLQFDFDVVAQIRPATPIICALTGATTEERLENSAAKSAAAA